MPGAEQSILIAVSPKVIYDVVLDVESYPEFLPETKQVTLLKDGKNPVAEFEISVIKKIHYTLKFSPTPHKKIAWTLVDSDLFKKNNGSWTFAPEGKGKTLATYAVDIDLGLMVPGMISRRLVGSSLPAMLKRFKERAEGMA